MIPLGNGRYFDAVVLGVYVLMMAPFACVLLVARDWLRRWGTS